MSGKLIPFYRVPIGRATRVGQVRVVRDRNGRYYADGAKAVSAERTGDYTALALADGRVFFVLTAELERAFS